MAARLQPPFRSLSMENYIGRGSAGQVYAISHSVVFKCPIQFVNPAPAQAEEMAESNKKMDHEKEIHRMLQVCRHANIIHSVLCVDEGLFMQRLHTTLECRILQSRHAHYRPFHARWITQIASGLAWLEDLGYAHGDLRPANILLNQEEDLFLADFDSSVKLGDPLLVMSEPFCKSQVGFEIPKASSKSEQFALGSCFYNIRWGHIPFHDLDPPTRVRKLMRNEFPSTSTDALFGDLIQSCWQGTFESINNITNDILPGLLSLDVAKDRDVDGAERLQALLVADCNDFLARERHTSNELSSSTAAHATSSKTDGRVDSARQA